MNPRATGYLYCVLAMISVGSTVVASKIIAAGLPPFTATALRFAVAFPIFALLMRMTRTPWPAPDRRDGLLLLLQAGAGSVGYTVLLISGVALASAADAGIVAGTLPAVAAAIAVLALGERPDRGLLAAVVLATAGVLVIVLRFDGAGVSLSWRALLGNALVFGAVVCEAIFILLNKKLRSPVAPLPLSATMSGIGLALAVLPALIEHPWTLGLDPAALLAVLYYALVPTVGGFLLWYAGSARISGTEAALFTALLPVSAVALSALVLHEAIGVAQLIGIGCVLGAIAIAATGGRKPV
jgi:drug/metabolite transporter (DMT)-like permease